MRKGHVKEKFKFFSAQEGRNKKRQKITIFRTRPLFRCRSTLAGEK
jgi:hypothetical protein